MFVKLISSIICSDATIDNETNYKLLLQTYASPLVSQNSLVLRVGKMSS